MRALLKPTGDKGPPGPHDLPAKPTGPTVTMSCVGCWAHWKVGVCVAGVKDITDMLDSVERSHQWNWNLSVNVGIELLEKSGVDSHGTRLRASLVLSCLGQAADVWYPLPGARHSAVRSRKPPSWGGHRSGEVPDHSARFL